MRTFDTSTLRAACLVMVASLAILEAAPARAGNPRGAAYCPAADRVFWFIQVSDLHVGTSGSNDTNRLTWIVTTGKTIIAPRFVVATGDLTDSTNANWLGIPNGPYQAEWDAYRAILDGRVDATNYFDIPGNHDAYSDRYFAYYLANSVQGRATGRTQASWTYAPPYGKYHFLGVNSADNTGDPFSILFPYGDHAGLDPAELGFIDTELTAHADANLTFVFGHHPVTDTGVSGDTWLFYGHQQFVGYLDQRAAAVYGFGHTHRYSESLFKGNSYTLPMAGDGIHYDNISSLAKDTPNHYMIYAVDCDGVSAASAVPETWPVVMITAPVNRMIGSTVNPFAYPVPASASNFVRALVFDAGAISSVSYRIDGGTTWTPMNRVASGSPIWQGTWDASVLAAGSHTIEVRAVGTTTRSDTIGVDVTAAANRAPVAANDSYTTPQDTLLNVAAPGVLGNDSDPDGDALAARVISSTAHGVLAPNADGSFAYTPQPGFSGSDSFTYVANDGTGDSNVAAVALTISPAPTTDIVTITTATYTKRTSTLRVEATSSQPGVAKLTASYVGGSGPMTYNKKTKRYSYQAVVSPAPATVSVTSDLGGSATRVVTSK